MSRARSAELALVAVAAVWGLTFTMVQDAIAHLPVPTFLAYRFIAAAAVVAAIWWRDLRDLDRDGWRIGLVMGAFLTAGYLAQTYGLQHTSASNAGFITGLFVVLTPLFGAVVLRAPPERLAWIAALASALGLFLLSGAASGARVQAAGDGVVLICAACFAAHILATDRGVERHQIGALLAVQLGVCGVTCLAVATVAGELEVPRGREVWAALVVTAFAASVVGFFVQSYAQRHADPARTALILAAEPAFAGLFGYLLAGDRLGAVEWLGATLIVVAILAVDAVPRLRPRRPLPEG